jgi:hypothetical protein
MAYVNRRPGESDPWHWWFIFLDWQIWIAIAVVVLLLTGAKA